MVTEIESYMQLIFFDIEKYITLIRLIFIPNFSKSSFSNHAYFSFEARKKKSTNKMEDKKIDNDIEAKLAEASKAYEDWLTSVEQREEEEK